MMEKLAGLTAAAINDLYGHESVPIFSRSSEDHGDFSINIAMQLAGKLGRSPQELAQEIADKIQQFPQVKEARPAGPGFINIRLQDSYLFTLLGMSHELDTPLAGKEVVAEYSDPNAFKVLHAGHLYTSLVGDVVANMLEAAGGNVHRVNFGGDVGLHVGKSMWAILRELGGEYPEKLAEIPDDQKLDWISEHYVKGNEAYEDDETAKQEIAAINKRIYQLHNEQDESSPFAQIYWKCREWSYDGFNALYERLGMRPFEKYYPESSVFELGLKTIKEHIGTVYKESDGAIVFDGEPYGLFTQVFINSEGLPTYAGKDVGLIQAKYRDYKFDTSYMITGAEQKDHLAVVLKSIEQFEPELAKNTIHRSHGRIKLAGGEKMSSRKGNILKADDVLDAAFSAYQQSDEGSSETIVLGAVRYSFLRVRIGGDIVYDPVESVSLEGNSGPYLQYALVRARSILRKLEDEIPADNLDEFDASERSLALKITEYPEAFNRALEDYSPHHICNYLYELATTFNRFYEKSRVIGDPRSSIRVGLVVEYEKVLSSGLKLLGMPQPEEM